MNPIHISSNTPVVARQETRPEINTHTNTTGTGPEYPEEDRDQLISESAVDEMIVRFTDYLDRVSVRIQKKINRIDRQIVRLEQRVMPAKEQRRA